MCSDEHFKAFAEHMRQEGFTDPLQSPDGAVLLPIIESRHISELYKRRQTRPDFRSETFDQVISPRASHASLSEFPLESRSRRASRQLVDAEKVSIMSAKAAGKKPQDAPGEDVKDASAVNGDLDVVSSTCVTLVRISLT